MRNFNPLSANPTKWPNTLKRFVGNLPANCLSVFDHFVLLGLKGLMDKNIIQAKILTRVCFIIDEYTIPFIVYSSIFFDIFSLHYSLVHTVAIQPGF